MLEMRDCNYHWNNKHLTRPEEIWIVMLINPKNINHFDEEQKPDLVKQSLGFAAWRIFAKKNGNFKRKWGSCCVFPGVGALEFLGNYTQLIWLPNFRLLGAKFSKSFWLFWLGVCLRLYLRGKHDLSGPKKKTTPQNCLSGATRKDFTNEKKLFVLVSSLNTTLCGHHIRMLNSVSAILVWSRHFRQNSQWLLFWRAFTREFGQISLNRQHLNR